MDTSIFEQVASSLTVKSICSSFRGPDLEASMSLERLGDVDLESYPNFNPYNDDPCRVIDSTGRAIGIIWWGSSGEGPEYEEAVVCQDIMEHINPTYILSSSTTIVEAVEHFGTKPNSYFFVFHVNELVGILYYSDLFKPLGRLAFLALALEIEDEALRLCQYSSIVEACWQSLSEGRRSKAIDQFKLNHEREPNFEDDNSRFFDITRLIACTQLSDKASMIWKQKSVTSDTQAFTGFFWKVEVTSG